MTRATKITLVTVGVAVVLVIIAVALFLATRPGPAPSPTSTDALPATRADTHVLDDVGAGAPTLVEFLDFECEVCGAVYPAIEELREQYAGEINYAFRYFPIPSHANSANAAIAVEAAAQQGRVEDMFHRMFETQAEWGEQTESKADLFRTFAQDLGLDMDAYDAAVADPATRERVQSDFDDGRAMGVSGTPTFFLDGELLPVQSLDDLTGAIDRALRD